MDLNNNSRSEMRAKRRKTNIILNTLITIVIILILIVAGYIFLGDSKTEKENKQNEVKTNQSEGRAKQTEHVTGTGEKKENSQGDTPKGEMVELRSEEPNVEKVIIDPSWEPIGTEQTDGHQPSTSMDSIDWKEKEKAAAYAINIPVENMINWWTARGSDPENQAILTVSEKGSSDTYRVFVEWVDGEGWKPTEVKKLIKNDKK